MRIHLYSNSIKKLSLLNLLFIISVICTVGWLINLIVVCKYCQSNPVNYINCFLDDTQKRFADYAKQNHLNRKSFSELPYFNQNDVRNRCLAGHNFFFCYESPTQLVLYKNGTGKFSLYQKREIKDCTELFIKAYRSVSEIEDAALLKSEDDFIRESTHYANQKNIIEHSKNIILRDFIH